MHRHSHLLWLISASLLTFSLQGQPLSTNSARPKVFRDHVEPHWFSNNDKFWYRLTNRTGTEFILVDAVKGTRTPAFDHDRLAKAFATLSPQPRPGQWLFDTIDFPDGQKSLHLSKGTNAWQCDFETYSVTEVKGTESVRTGEREDRRRRRGRPDLSRLTNAAKSPNRKWEAFVRDHNLFLRNLNSGEERALTKDAGAKNTYTADGQRNRFIEMQYEAPLPDASLPEVFWSPDSKRLVAMRTAPGTNRTVYLVESSPASQVQPRLQSYPYLKPGDEIPVQKPHLFDVDGLAEIPVDQALFPNPWSISELRWSTNSSRFSFLYNQRGHQVLRIVAVDAKTGEAKAIVDEQAKTFIDYSGKSFSSWVDDAGEIIWMSERDGWNHLYLYDAASGKVKNQITKGEWVVRSVDRVDREKRQIWFTAGGIRPGQDPYFIQYCLVNFDGTGLVILTDGNGTHAVQFSPDRRWLIDTWSRVDMAPVSELRSAEGKLICKLEEADIADLSASNWRPPEPFVAKARDGETEIYGVIHRPHNFDATKKYPVIESIYAGPHGSFVPKSFRASYSLEKLADRGFVVVQIDGMGTSNRSKKFHDICWKNIGDAGFPDRILWMKAAASKYPHMDLSRVGVYGGSAGGQNALRALLAYGDFYKAAAADCGCHDNRMDKIWWNEQWMGWPVGPHYAEQSNVTQAHKLKGKLLLTFAELDKNVDPASTLQVVDALIKADKDFELIIFPGAGHGAGSSRYGDRRRADFFVRSLLHDQPGPDGTTLSSR